MKLNAPVIPPGAMSALGIHRLPDLRALGILPLISPAHLRRAMGMLPLEVTTAAVACAIRPPARQSVVPPNRWPATDEGEGAQ